jgi:hypothetical protein
MESNRPPGLLLPPARISRATDIHSANLGGHESSKERDEVGQHFEDEFGAGLTLTTVIRANIQLRTQTAS